MIKEFVYAVKYVLGKDLAGRDFTVFPDDTFIVSYPRSGNTWTRFLVANLLHPQQPVTFANIEQLVPDIHAQSKRFLKRVPRPRVIKSHEYFDPRYKKVIYIVRDPRDVALSYYHFLIKYRGFDEDYPMDRYVTRFVSGDLNEFGSWGDNVASWLGTRRGRQDLLLLQYEDMIAQTANELAKIASHLGVEVTPERLSKAMERSSAEEMRKLERVQADKWVTTKKGRKDKPFVRSATSGGWKSALPERSVAEIEAAWGDLMRTLGYEPAIASFLSASRPVEDKSRLAAEARKR